MLSAAVRRHFCSCAGGRRGGGGSQVDLLLVLRDNQQILKLVIVRLKH